VRADPGPAAVHATTVCRLRHPGVQAETPCQPNRPSASCGRPTASQLVLQYWKRLEFFLS